MTHYSIAGYSIEVSGNGLSAVPSFLPFIAPQNTDNEAPMLRLQTGVAVDDPYIAPYCFYSFPCVEKDLNYSLAVKDYTWFMKIEKSGRTPFYIEIENRHGRCYAKTNMDEHTPAIIVCYAFLMAFGIVFVQYHTALIHASVVTHKGKAIIFLGDSGTGKSTQSRLWLEHIPYTELLNDDTPLIRVMNDCSVSVFGAPWSGKTPCYKNKSAPIAAFVQLSQAPHNQITQLKRTAGLGAVLHAIAKSLRLDEALFEKITDIVSVIIEQIPVYRLECLPNAEAAYLVFNTLKESGRL